MSKKIGVVSLGCPKNLVDTETMLGLLEKENYEFTQNSEEADILIVNTCCFIESAKEESIEAILELAQYKRTGKCDLLIVTGCMAERYNDQITREIPEVDAVVGTGDYAGIVSVLEEAYKGEKVVRYGHLDRLEDKFTTRKLSLGTPYAYLKIAEGCNNCCTYCVIPSLRGRYRSRSMDSIIEEAQFLAQNGIKELILVAQDTTRYGTDIGGEKMLVPLLKRLEEIADIRWIRLLYCYPEEIDDSLISYIASSRKVLHYLDIPIQHASNDILKKMGRRGTAEQNMELLGRLREAIPDIVVRTSLITGFPGETEEDFELLRKFVSDVRFDHLGVFAYSREEGTPAYSMKPQVPARVKKQRQKQIMEIQKAISAEKNKAKIGNTFEVLVEGVADDGIFYYGRSYADAPEIDGVFYLASPRPLEFGTFVKARVLDANEYDLTGEVLE